MSLIQKTKSFLGFDIKADKYALVDDPIFGKVSKENAPVQKGTVATLKKHNNDTKSNKKVDYTNP
jgi:hypothetical protein